MVHPDCPTISEDCVCVVHELLLADQHPDLVVWSLPQHWNTSTLPENIYSLVPLEPWARSGNLNHLVQWLPVNLLHPVRRHTVYVQVVPQQGLSLLPTGVRINNDTKTACTYVYAPYPLWDCMVISAYGDQISVIIDTEICPVSAHPPFLMIL